ncbi:MAG: molybdenum cofactor biosynthesis protein MoaE [Candidatus Poseidoniaceae archaeon]|nr:molybdenum cofactor biosynthesis protein MoaE [Candidatus Poseidoniaceae archaeon]
MQGRIYIQNDPEKLDIEILRNKLITRECGAIVSFVGITRDFDQDEKVLHLEFDAWQETLNSTLYRLAEEAIENFSIHSIAMGHRTGVVGPGETIVVIHVASPHRKEAFLGCSWLIDELKNQAPLWKKEVKPSGATWKAGLG